MYCTSYTHTHTHTEINVFGRRDKGKRACFKATLVQSGELNTPSYRQRRLSQTTAVRPELCMSMIRYPFELTSEFVVLQSVTLFLCKLYLGLSLLDHERKLFRKAANKEFIVNSTNETTNSNYFAFSRIFTIVSPIPSSPQSKTDAYVLNIYLHNTQIRLF